MSGIPDHGRNSTQMATSTSAARSATAARLATVASMDQRSGSRTTAARFGDPCADAMSIDSRDVSTAAAGLVALAQS
jgi:hypothetical protein